MSDYIERAAVVRHGLQAAVVRRGLLHHGLQAAVVRSGVIRHRLEKAQYTPCGWRRTRCKDLPQSWTVYEQGTHLALGTLPLQAQQPNDPIWRLRECSCGVAPVWEGDVTGSGREDPATQYLRLNPYVGVGLIGLSRCLGQPVYFPCVKKPALFRPLVAPGGGVRARLDARVDTPRTHQTTTPSALLVGALLANFQTQSLAGFCDRLQPNEERSFPLLLQGGGSGWGCYRPGVGTAPGGDEVIPNFTATGGNQSGPAVYSECQTPSPQDPCLSAPFPYYRPLTVYGTYVGTRPLTGLFRGGDVAPGVLYGSPRPTLPATIGGRLTAVTPVVNTGSPVDPPAWRGIDQGWQYGQPDCDVPAAVRRQGNEGTISPSATVLVGDLRAELLLFGSPQHASLQIGEPEPDPATWSAFYSGSMVSGALVTASVNGYDKQASWGCRIYANGNPNSAEYADHTFYFKTTQQGGSLSTPHTLLVAVGGSMQADFADPSRRTGFQAAGTVSTVAPWSGLDTGPGATAPNQNPPSGYNPCWITYGNVIGQLYPSYYSFTRRSRRYYKRSLHGDDGGVGQGIGCGSPASESDVVTLRADAPSDLRELLGAAGGRMRFFVGPFAWSTEYRHSISGRKYCPNLFQLVSYTSETVTEDSGELWVEVTATPTYSLEP